MSPLFLKALVLSNALLLTLPPGACSYLLTARAEAAETSCPCCPEPKPENPTPEFPPFNCCCQFEATPAPHPEMLTPDLILCGIILPVVVHDLASPLTAHIEFAAHDSSPPLQILHCTWTC